MEQLAEPGRRCSPSTPHLVSDCLAARSRRRAGEGRQRAAAHHALDIGRLQTRFDASRARGLSPLVGRERELALLEDALPPPRPAAAR
jgi:hypothetical protein